MIRSNGAFPVTATHTDVSFEALDEWPPTPAWAAGTPGGDGLRLASIVFGDRTAGPMLTLWAVPPDEKVRDPAPPHSHGTDTLQVALRGALHFTHRAFGPREFRFNQSAKAYGGERHGTEEPGTWTVEMMADRRGWLMRPVNSALIEAMRAGQDKAIVEMRDLTPEVFAIDRPGASTLRTNVGVPARSGELAGSFDESGSWSSLAGCRSGVALLGDAEVGPVSVLVRAAPNQAIIAAMTAPCDILILPVRGHCRVGIDHYRVGRFRLQREGQPLPELAAGEDGVDVIVVVGDRRVLDSRRVGGWLTALRDTISSL